MLAVSRNIVLRGANKRSETQGRCFQDVFSGVLTPEFRNDRRRRFINFNHRGISIVDSEQKSGVDVYFLFSIEDTSVTTIVLGGENQDGFQFD